MFFNKNSPQTKNLRNDVYDRKAGLAFTFSITFVLIALFILLLFAIGEAKSKHVFLDILGVVIICAFASFAGGGVIGFLFGIPHTLQQNTQFNDPSSADNSNNSKDTTSSPNTAGEQNQTGTKINTSQTVTPAAASSNWGSQSKSNFRPSTNLEQIADWLTKIIVGVGLIEVHKIITRFNQLCIALGETLKHYSTSQLNGSLIIGSLIIFFSIEGFLIVYLWTYLYLIKIQDSMISDILDTVNATIENTDKNDKRAIDLASTQLYLSENAPDIPLNELVQAFNSASENVISSIFFGAVDQRKRNWKDLKPRMERTIPIFQALIAHDSSFDYPENYVELGYALKDKSIPDYKEAFSCLDKAIGGLSNNTTRVINKAMIYFNRAYCRIKLDENFAKTLPSDDKNKEAIKSDLAAAKNDPAVKSIILNDDLIKQWSGINSVDLSTLVS